MMPLTMVQPGERRPIQKITGKNEVRRHLAELGFVTGACVTVVAVSAGNMILQIKESRIALDKKIAMCILI